MNDDPLVLAALKEVSRELPSGAPVLDLGCGAEETWLWVLASKGPSR